MKKLSLWIAVALVCFLGLTFLTCDDDDSSTSSEQDDDDTVDDDDDDDTDDDDTDDDDDTTDDDDEAGNYALEFAGKEQYVQVPESYSLDITGTEITVEAWVYAHAIDPEAETGIAKKMFSDFYLGDVGWKLYLYEGKVRFAACNTLCFIARADDAFVLDKWTHVAGTYNGEESAIWIDGVKAGSRAAEGIPFGDYVTTSSVIIGATSINEWQGFDLVIDEVRITEADLYESAFTPEQTLSVGEYTRALWHFDEGEGLRVYDASEHENEGAVNGATWVERE